jgi:peptide/nickel transport system permease protein
MRSKYLVYRLIQAFWVWMAVLLLSFIIFRILPGDPAAAIAGDPRVSAQMREILAKKFGLDRPLYEQFAVYLFNVFKLELGVSYLYKLPVIQILSGRLVNTLLLLIPATILSMALGILMGLLSGGRRGKPLDYSLTSLATLQWSTPEFWAAMLMIYAFAIALPIFPTGGLHRFGISHKGFLTILLDRLYHLALPMITYAVIWSGQYTLVVRNTLSEVLSEDYIVMAKAKGLKNREILRKHALKNVMLPLVTLIGLNMGYIMLGQIGIETVFTYPGVGRLVYDAVIWKDLPMLQGTFLLFALIMIISMLLIDIIYTYLDPRVKLE